MSFDLKSANLFSRKAEARTVRIYIDLQKAGLKKGNYEVGEDRGGAYIKRVVTGKDKDGSPQYRYLRTQEEVDAYERMKDKHTATHEKQKAEAGKDEDLASKKAKEDKKQALLIKPDADKTKKSLYIKVGK